MKRTLLFQRLAIFLSTLSLLAVTGCDSSPGPLGDAPVATGAVQRIGSNSLTVNATDYAVTRGTKFKSPLAGLSDLSVGDAVAMRYEKKNGAMQVLEVENDQGGDYQDGDHDEQEVSGSVSEVGSDYLVVSDTTFAVTSDTEFEDGYAALSDVQAGDQAEVEYETQSDGTNVALEVEKDDGEDDDGEDNDQDGDHQDGDHDEQEVSGSVSEVGSDYLVVSDTTFAVTSDTEFEEGYDNFSDVQSGDRAEVEYETRGGENVALGIEKGGDDGEDEDDDEGDY